MLYILFLRVKYVYVSTYSLLAYVNNNSQCRIKVGATDAAALGPFQK